MTRSIAIIIGMMASLLAAACESAPKAGAMNQAVDDYNSQRFSEAHQNASAVQSRAAAGAREDAAYLAGLAAYKMGDLHEAEQRLLTASRSPSIETVAKSKAMLGEIRLEQRRPRDAAALLVDAYPNLSSEDARHCAYSAAVAYQQAGDSSNAQQWLTRSGHSRTAAQSPAPATPATVQRTGATNARPSTGFALQVGAFHEKSRAQQAAEDAERLAQREGLGPVRTFTRRDERGEKMYVVQFGLFPTRESAAAARSKIGKLQYIVAPATPAS